MARPAATISVDVDPVDLHLLGYGYSGLKPDPLVYQVAVPRLIERFAKAGVRGTFFVVGRDAAEQQGALRALTAAGHEVASHSHSHPLSLASLPDDRLRLELENSRTALSQASATDVIGFRAPNFDMNRRTLRALVAAGYRYDASAYPTPLLLPMRVVLALKSADPAAVLRLTLWPFTLNRDPHTLEGLREFPLSVTPAARLPVYHTARYFMEEARFHAQIEGFATRGESLSYVLHAVDVLGLAEDHVDVRLAAHPGMRRPLEEKVAMLDRALETIARGFDVQTFAARLDAS